MNENYHVNYFIKPIYDRKHKGFNLIEWWKLRKFIKELSKTSPNFSMLVEIYHFLTTLSNVYSYPNTEKNPDCFMYTVSNSSGYASKPDVSFCIRRGTMTITYSLWYDESWIEIVKSTDYKDSKSSATRYKFMDGDAIINNTDEEHTFLNIITITMDAVSDLVKYYWKNKFRGY